jgi:hypothetical protein
VAFHSAINVQFRFICPIMPYMILLAGLPVYAWWQKRERRLHAEFASPAAGRVRNVGGRSCRHSGDSSELWQDDHRADEGRLGVRGHSGLRLREAPAAMELNHVPRNRQFEPDAAADFDQGL